MRGPDRVATVHRVLDEVRDQVAVPAMPCHAMNHPMNQTRPDRTKSNLTRPNQTNLHQSRTNQTRVCVCVCGGGDIDQNKTWSESILRFGLLVWQSVANCVWNVDRASTSGNNLSQQLHDEEDKCQQ
jgi:hypothetical protein